MTEQEIRKEVKRDFRRTRWANFIETFKTICFAVLCTLPVLAIMAVLFIHLFAVVGEPPLRLTHGWIIATGILAIPGALIYLGFFAMLLALPIIKIIEKVKDHNKQVDDAVERYKTYYKKEGKYK